MNNDFFDQEPDGKARSTQQIISKLVENIYPFMFEQLDILSVKIKFYDNDPCVFVFRSHINNVRQQLVDMYFYEKQELFPQILKLEEENKKSPTCQPFKNVVPFYKSARKELAALRTAIGETKDAKPSSPEIEGIISFVSDFENDIQNIQRTKEQQLYTPYRKCIDCKALSV